MELETLDTTEPLVVVISLTSRETQELNNILWSARKLKLLSGLSDDLDKMGYIGEDSEGDD